jgi:NAD+ diphosphatase
MVGFAARTEPGAPLFPRAGEIEEAHWFDRAAVRRMIAAESAIKGGGDRWLAPRPDHVPEGAAFEVILPGPVSIARRMIEGWVASG